MTEWPQFISKARHSNVPTTNAAEAKVDRFSEYLEDLLELTSKKWCSIHHWWLECKSRKSRNTWHNSEFGLGEQKEVGQRLIEFCQENELVIANTCFQQHKRRLYTWPSPSGQYWNHIDYILCNQWWRSYIQLYTWTWTNFRRW